MILPRPIVIGFLVLTGLSACALLSCRAPGSRRDPHFERARSLMLEIEGKHGRVDYTRPEYDEVVRELDQVPPDSPNSKEVKEILTRIRRARGEPEPPAKSAQAPLPAATEMEEPPREESPPATMSSPDFDLAMVEQGDRTEGGRLVIYGRVRNVGDREIGRVLVILNFTDRTGKILRNHVSHLDQDVLPVGGEGTFVVRIPADPSMARYTVRFREMSGGDLRLRSGP